MLGSIWGSISSVVETACIVVPQVFILANVIVRLTKTKADDEIVHKGEKVWNDAKKVLEVITVSKRETRARKIEKAGNGNGKTT